MIADKRSHLVHSALVKLESHSSPVQLMDQSCFIYNAFCIYLYIYTNIPVLVLPTSRSLSVYMYYPHFTGNAMMRCVSINHVAEPYTWKLVNWLHVSNTFIGVYWCIGLRGPLDFFFLNKTWARHSKQLLSLSSVRSLSPLYGTKPLSSLLELKLWATCVD